MSIFFLDRNFGTRKFAEILRKAGVDFRLHDDCFNQDTPDDKWIAVVSKKGWVILTLDKQTRRKPVEKQAILVHKARVIYLSAKSGDMITLAKDFIGILPKIERFIGRHPAPFLASITRPPRKRYAYSKEPECEIRLLKL